MLTRSDMRTWSPLQAARQSARSIVASPRPGPLAARVRNERSSAPESLLRCPERLLECSGILAQVSERALGSARNACSSQAGIRILDHERTTRAATNQGLAMGEGLAMGVNQGLADGREPGTDKRD